MRPAPGTALVALFDGQCAVCVRSAAWVAQRDPAGRVERLDLRDPAAASRFASFAPDAVRDALHVVDAAGRTWIGIDALGRLLAELDGWRPMGRLLVAPGVRPATKVAYAWFARRRLWFNRFFPLAEKGCDGTCSHPSSTEPRPAQPPSEAPRLVDGRSALRRP